MFRKSVFLFLLVLLIAPAATTVTAQPSGLPVDVPREEVFVVDQILRYGQPGNFNFWVTGGENPVHRHALMMETFWYRDQETGERIYGVASSDPVYNDDFTQLNVELRDNVFWTDGELFDADDVVFTIETLKANSDLGASGWHSALVDFLDSIEKTGDFSVQFNLTEPNPRFHTLLEARWNGIYMMPEHVFSSIDDIAATTYTEGPYLGSYVPVQSDPNGFWELFERREDWENSPAGMITGNAGPRYILTVFYGDSTRKVIAMSRGELDVFFDVDFEAFEEVLETTPTARSWYTDFPWAYPNEVSSRQLSFNYETNPEFNDPSVRWAMALAIDIVELQTEYIGGVAKVTPIPVPATSALMEMYHNPMEEWLTELQIDLGDGTMYNPYDPTVPDRIAEWAVEQGYEIDGTPREVFGAGWWKFDLEAAETLLLNAGFTRDGDNWLTPDGERWSIQLTAAPDEPDAFRIANAAADMWSEFGIEVDLQGLERQSWQNGLYLGDFDVSVPWSSFVQVSGDSWPETRTLHPNLYAPVGEDTRTTGGTSYTAAMRLQDPRIGEFIDAMVPVNPDSEENIELVTEFVQYWTENLYFISTISFKKFITWDERYWTNFPTFENPSFQPLYWFSGGKFAFQSLTPIE